MDIEALSGVLSELECLYDDCHKCEHWSPQEGCTYGKE